MKAYKCDICGDYFNQVEFRLYDGRFQIKSTFESNGGVKINVNTFDICPNCKAAIERVIEKRRKLNESNN